MFSRWKTIDIILAVMFVLTNIFYFVSRQTLFPLLLWPLIILAVVRVLLLVRKRLFWQIRNRLIFSGLFLIITPMIFLCIFFYITLNIVIAQYGMVIIENVVDNTRAQFEQLAANYLVVDKSTRLIQTKRLLKVETEPFNAVLWEKNEGSWETFFTYPGDFEPLDPRHKEFSGYYMQKGKMYLGVLKKSVDAAVLLSTPVDQPMLDRMGAVSDFRMKYQDPKDIKGKDPFKIAADLGLLDEQSSFSIPWVFYYQYLDFDTLKDNAPVQARSQFWLLLDFGLIHKKITDVKSSPLRTPVKRIIYLLSAFFGTFIIISLIIGFRSVAVVTRSINLITQGTQKIRNGDFSFRIRTRSRDQLQYLAESFNEMAAGIDRLLVDEKEKQRLEEELRIARSIQLKLLPDDSFEADEFEIAAVNIPAEEIAGDYFDYFYREGEYLSLLVADVSGKGTSAAFYMAELKGVINHLQKKHVPPATVIGECHESLSTSFDRVTFITMNMAKFLVPEKKFLLARAGHTPALFYSAEEKKCRELFPKGVAIGLMNFDPKKIEESETSYKSGDILFLFSDGLSEIMNEEDEMLGVDNLKYLICKHNECSAAELKQKLLDFSIEFSQSTVNRDDLTFIILKVK